MFAISDSTIPGRRIPVVVLITPGAALLAVCEKVVHYLDEVPTVKVADLVTASTIIAEWRPFAVVIPEPVFAFDPEEFASLARSVGAHVLVVETENASTALVGRLFPKLNAALASWEARRGGSP